jgi:hypothetical protein
MVPITARVTPGAAALASTRRSSGITASAPSAPKRFLVGNLRPRKFSNSSASISSPSTAIGAAGGAGRHSVSTAARSQARRPASSICADSTASVPV